MNIYTFEAWWAAYHRLTYQPKVNKELCRKLWNKTIYDLQREAFTYIQDYKFRQVTAYDYLKRIFKFDKN